MPSTFHWGCSGEPSMGQEVKGDQDSGWDHAGPPGLWEGLSGKVGPALRLSRACPTLRPTDWADDPPLPSAADTVKQEPGLKNKCLVRRRQLPHLPSWSLYLLRPLLPEGYSGFGRHGISQGWDRPERGQEASVPGRPHCPEQGPGNPGDSAIWRDSGHTDRDQRSSIPTSNTPTVQTAHTAAQHHRTTEQLLSEC